MTMTVASTRRQHDARPGRRAVVAASLADLHGPVSGKVTLPLRLYWSPAGRVFSLDDPDLLLAMYEAVLNEAARRDELAEWLNGERLATVWADLYLPRGVRRAWEERHPQLRTAAAVA